MFPAISHKVKRAITREEHAAIVARELNPERRAFYQLCWHLGGSQTDIATLTAEDIDWRDHTVCYDRKKLRAKAGPAIRPALIRFGDECARVLKSLPAAGPLFPSLRRVKSKDRANEFRQRCQGLKIFGISLHYCRYAWAERARSAGYPERLAFPIALLPFEESVPGIKHRLCLKASRNAGQLSRVSDRALRWALPTLSSFAQGGTSPQRISCTSGRWFRMKITGASWVGAMLYRGA
jgi:hypothetical protein